jgi:PTH1 family peptidyl-tRNA hydrolase
MRSIIAALGTDGFPRLRIGIDRPPGRMDPAAYVLQDFSREQEEVMVQVRDQAVSACEHWLAYGISSAMNVFNVRGLPGDEPQP